jgi:acetate kinase
MEEKCVVINSGSSSIKLEVFAVPGLASLAEGVLEKIGTLESRLKQRRVLSDGSVREEVHTRAIADHRAGFDFILEVNARDRIIHDPAEVAAIGHRVVHGGDRFAAPTLIDDGVAAAIRDLIPLAPLHNPANLLGIEEARRRFPKAPHVAVFDTAFHQTLPPHAFRYAVPAELYEQHRVRRYGFHGSSHAYVARPMPLLPARRPRSAAATARWRCWWSPPTRNRKSPAKPWWWSQHRNQLVSP